MFRVACVGLRRGQSFLEVFSRLPECTVAAVCDLDEDLAREVASRYAVPAVHTDLAALLEEPLDLLVVASPPHLHVPHSVAALQRGLHVLCEVPAADSLEECPLLVEAARAGPGKYMLAENCDYWAFHASWRELHAQGRLGHIMYAEAEYIHCVAGLKRHPDGSPTWRAFIPPLHYCTHSLGPLLRLTGDRVVSATGLSTGAHVEPEFGTPDMELGLFRTERGTVIKVLCGFGVVREPGFHYYSVYGSRGTLETTRGADHPFGTTLAYFDDLPHLQGMIRLPLGTNLTGAPGWAAAAGHGTAEWAMILDFLRCLREGGEPPIDVYRALDYSAPGLVAHQSALAGGALLEVPDFRAL